MSQGILKKNSILKKLRDELFRKNIGHTSKFKGMLEKINSMLKKIRVHFRKNIRYT